MKKLVWIPIEEEMPPLGTVCLIRIIDFNIYGNDDRILTQLNANKREACLEMLESFRTYSWTTDYGNLAWFLHSTPSSFSYNLKIEQVSHWQKEIETQMLDNKDRFEYIDIESDK